MTAARSLDAAAAAAAPVAGAAGGFPVADGLTDGTTVLVAAPDPVPVGAEGRSSGTELLFALDTPLAAALGNALDTARDTAVGAVTCPVSAALPWLEQPVANVTRSVTPATAAAAERDRAGVRRLTPVPW